MDETKQEHDDPEPTPDLGIADSLVRRRKVANDVRLCPRCGARGRQLGAVRQSPYGLRRRRQCRNAKCVWRWTSLELDHSRVRVVLTLERLLADALNTIRRWRPQRVDP